MTVDCSVPNGPLPRLNRVDRLRLRHLRLLEAISETGSLSRAAQRLHLSPPVATTMLQELEEAFRGTLVERSARGGRLSPSGARALDRLRVALAFIDAAATASAADSEPPVLRIGTHTLAAQCLLPPVLGRLHARGLLQRILVTEDTATRLVSALKSGRLDCMIGRLGSRVLGEAESSGFYSRPVYKSSFAVIASAANPLTRRRKVRLQALLEHEWVGFPAGTYSRQFVDDLFLAAALPVPRHVVEINSAQGILATVAASSMLTMIDTALVQDQQALGRVKALRLDCEPAEESLFFVCHRMALQHPGVSLLLSALDEARHVP